MTARAVIKVETESMTERELLDAIATAAKQIEASIELEHPRSRGSRVRVRISWRRDDG